jgi:hypothetical protein
MKQTIANPSPLVSLVSAISLLVAASSQAAFTSLPSPTPEFPGVPLGANQATGGGTVLATLNSSFVDNAMPTSFASGILRSFVVDRGGGLLDFYYQLINTSAPPPDMLSEFFRMKTLGGFDPSLVLSVGQTDSLAGLVAGSGSGFVAGSYTTGAGLQAAATADRDVATLGSVGFDFPTQPPPAFIGDPNNVEQGESSTFLVVRTNSKSYGNVQMTIDGAGTSFANTFAPVPEPGSMIFGLAVLGITFVSRRRASRA